MLALKQKEKDLAIQLKSCKDEFQQWKSIEMTAIDRLDKDLEEAKETQQIESGLYRKLVQSVAEKQIKLEDWQHKIERMKSKCKSRSDMD